MALGAVSRFSLVAKRALYKLPGFEKPQAWAEAALNSEKYEAVIKKDEGLSRSILLKEPGQGGERGVLLMTFEYNWARLLSGMNKEEIGWLEHHYQLVFSTSWSPTDFALLGLLASSFSHPVWVQTNNRKDIPLIEGFHPRLRCVETMPCDWINPGFYEPKLHEEREIDFLMVSNWAVFKRHWEFFEALSRMPKDLKVVLVGQPESGNTKDGIIRLAKRCGVKQKIELFESIPIEEVSKYQCNAKVSVIMSRREGCCVAAVESLFAGSALAMREDAHVGALDYVNEMTGKRLRIGHIAEDLTSLLETAASLDPRKWAVDHISCERSHQKLEASLKWEAEAIRQPWTRALALHQWRPYPMHVHSSDKERLRPAYEDLHERFPQVFPKTLIDESWR